MSPPATRRRLLGPFSLAPFSPVGRRELFGLGTIAAFILWALIASLLNNRMPPLSSPFVYAPFMAIAGIAFGRCIANRLSPTAMVAGLVLLATGLLIGAGSGDSGAPPLGYSNANAGLAAQLLALCGLASLASKGTIRLVAGLAGLGALAALVASWSRAGLVVSVPLVLAVGLALTGWVRRRWWPPTLGALTLLAGAAGVVVLATREEWPPLAIVAFSSVRQQLWADALELWQQRPVVGSGPGAFRDYNPLATDTDLAAAHSSILQIAAETGLIGVALFGLLIATGFALAFRGTPTRALIASAAWTVLILHSFIDHLLEFSLLVVTAGVVLGMAGARANSGRISSEELDVGERERPLPSGWHGSGQWPSSQ